MFSVHPGEFHDSRPEDIHYAHRQAHSQAHAHADDAHAYMQMMHMLLRPEDVHDAHAALALPPHHSSYNPGEISD